MQGEKLSSQVEGVMDVGDDDEGYGGLYLQRHLHSHSLGFRPQLSTLRSGIRDCAAIIGKAKGPPYWLRRDCSDPRLRRST
jgi:hypothetical protein